VATRGVRIGRRIAIVGLVLVNLALSFVALVALLLASEAGSHPNDYDSHAQRYAFAVLGVAVALLAVGVWGVARLARRANDRR
jgi:hypothetical protein